tara:strand:- start:669 stop:2243 length:1575 start_codon:yes stop_codon:yes gene_type:complete
MSKQSPYVMFIVGRMNPPTPGHVKGLIIPFLHAVREQAIKILSCRDCLTDEENRWCLPDQNNPNGHCFKADEIDSRVPGSRSLACSDDRTIITQSTACTERADLPDDFEQLINAANLTVRIYLTNTSNKSRMKRPWKDKPIVEKIKENGVNELLADNPANFAEQAEENNYYVKYYYLENPLDPSEKKMLLAKMIKAALDKSRDNDVINMDSRIINNMIVTGDEGAGEGNFCANQGIKSAIECAQFLQKRIDPANRTIDPRHIILVMGEEEDRSERQRREKFCFKGALDNDETTKVRCNTLKRITIDTTPQDFQDVNDDDPQGEPIEFNDESMSASKVRLSIANDSSNDFQLVRQLYSEYLNGEDIEFMINNVRSGLYIQGASPPLPLPQQRRYNSRFIPEQQRQIVDQQGVLDSAKKHYAAAFWSRSDIGTRAFGLGLTGEAVSQELSDVRENDGLPASLHSNPGTSEDTRGGRKKKRKTRRKYKRKSRTRKKNRSVSTTRKKNIKTRRSQIGCKGKNTKRHRR